MDRWIGKYAIVTGVSSGIGESIARELVAAGVNVLGLARRENRLQDLAENLKNSKGAFHYLKCDLRNEQDILDAFAFAEKSFGRVDILINNAGLVFESTLANAKTDNYRALLDVNLLAPALCIREALKLMRKYKTQGHIVNINSITGLNATVITGPINLYPASKFALRAITETLKQEIHTKKDKIRVTGIHPGLVQTEICDTSETLQKGFSLLPALDSKDVTDCVIFALSVPPHVQSARMDRWAGKFAIVTGVSSGIGEVLAKELVTLGVNVLGLARRENRLQELSKSLKNSKGAFHYLKCDLRNEQDILNAFAFAEKNFGRVDILVNNAAILTHDTFENAKTEDYRALLDINVLAPALCIREALKSMRKHKNEGHIININSVAGHNAAISPVPVNLYPASKFALRAMTETLKLEIKTNNDKIRITGIHPGLVKTEIINAIDGISEILKVMPYLESKDVVDCVIFALSAPPHVQIDELTVTAYTNKA
ncbi:uncharacterized protein LOC130663244 [Microplitis mediator]|uniref:uncharacterized protein LOC130663244 n=1 Tax=Microplitis mediator TaxID=375433 RepID=UPI002556E941|nr:uncharacterized protein LOC130663244 [Microplitis mediator]